MTDIRPTFGSFHNERSVRGARHREVRSIEEFSSEEFVVTDSSLIGAIIGDDGIVRNAGNGEVADGGGCGATDDSLNGAIIGDDRVVHRAGNSEVDRIEVATS